MEIFDKYLLKSTSIELGASQAANETTAAATEVKGRMDKQTNREETDEELEDRLDKGQFGKA